jgi:hypothetical protein
MQRVRLDTYKDLFNNALSLFEWAVEEAEVGRKLISFDEQDKRSRELAMPVIDRLKRRSARPKADGANGRHIGP